MLIRRMRVFVRQSEAQEDARHFKRVMHLCDERNRSSLADEDCALAESHFQSLERDFKERVGIRRDPRLSLAVDIEFELHSFWQ